MQHPIYSVSDFELIFKRLKVNITGSQIYCIQNKPVNQSYDRSLRSKVPEVINIIITVNGDFIDILICFLNDNGI